MKQFPVIEITASDPFERGVQYGTQAKELIGTCIQYYKNKFAGQDWDSVVTYAMDYVPVIEESMPEILAEARGVAQGAGVPFGDIMVVNCRYEITKFPKIPECTTGALLPKASEGGKTYAWKNWDYASGILDHVVILHFHTDDGYRAIGITEAGQMVRDGMNSYGVAICNNNLQSVEDYPGSGIPATFLRRRVLASKSFEEAKEWILNSKRCVSNNTVLVGKGQALDFEAYPSGANIIEPDEDGILAHANHFVVHPELDAIHGRPKNRDARFVELVKPKAGHITVEDIKEALRDHKYYPLSICGHTDPDGDDYGRDRMTVSSMIADFDAQEVHICAGNPCQGEYIVYKL